MDIIDEENGTTLETCKFIYQNMETNLEIVSECSLDEDLKILKEKYIEHCLCLDNITSSSIYKKSKCVTTYISNGERVYLSRDKYFDLIKKLNKFELSYVFLTHNPHIVKYINKTLKHYKHQILQEDGFLYTKKENTDLIENVKKISPHIYYTTFGEEVEKVLCLKKIEQDFFDVKDWETKENIKKIEQGIIPTHSHTTHNKLNLLKTLRNNGNLQLVHTDIVDIIRNNNLPYMNYDELKLMLTHIQPDNDLKNNIEIFDNLEEAFIHGLCLSKEKTNFVMVNEGDRYLLYSSDKLNENHPDPESYFSKEDKDYSLGNRIISSLFKEKPENIINKQVPFEVDNKIKSIDYFNILDNYIIENNNPNFEIILAGHPYTRKEKILNRFIDVEIYYISTNIVEIYVIYNKKETLIVKDFYLPKDLKVSMISCIKLLWHNGYLLNDYGYNYYVKYNKVLSKSIYSPWWFQASNNKEIKSLIKFIKQLKDDY